MPPQMPATIAGAGSAAAIINVFNVLERQTRAAENMRQQVIQGDLYAGSGLNPLPSKSGGVVIENSNFFLDGIGRETESLMRGYYLISYTPPADTFKADKKEIFNKIKIKVKRKNVEVYTRDGFYGRLKSETDADAPKNPLFDAIFSPFQYADLDVNIAAGYVRDAKAGYLVRSWIHLNPGNVEIVETENGGARIDLETICLTSDINGYVHDLRHIKYAFNIDPEKKAENLAWIRKHGIRFTLLLPVKRPGSYYVRVSVQDTESNKVGSAYQFLEVPDLGKKGLNLSNMFMITSADDINWMNSDATKEISEGVFSLVFQPEEVRSPALRTYAPGDVFQTLSIIYNADEKAVSSSGIETQSVLYKDGREYMRGEPKPVNPEGAANPEDIPVSQMLSLGTDLTLGDYVLQLLVTDKKNGNKKEGVASQTIGFTVAEDF